MKWINTPDSTMMIGFGYVKKTQILTVHFKHGARYNYYDVPETVFEEMKTASSKGQFFALNIRDCYQYAPA